MLNTLKFSNTLCANAALFVYLYLIVKQLKNFLKQ